MTVKELIEKLSKCNPDKMVVVRGYEGGCDEVGGIAETRINLNVNTEWYYGKHEYAEDGEREAVQIG